MSEITLIFLCEGKAFVLPSILKQNLSSFKTFLYKFLFTIKEWVVAIG